MNASDQTASPRNTASQRGTVIGAASPGVAAALGVTALAGPLGWISGLTAAVLAIAGFGLAAAVAAQQRRQRATLQGYLNSRQEFAAGLVPVWSGQIEYSRTHMETAIAALAGRFSGIVDKLDRTLKGSDVTTQSAAGGEHGMVAVFEQSERELSQLVTGLEAASAVKAQMVDQVHALGKYVKELQKMASDVALLASQTNLLAIN